MPTDSRAAFHRSAAAILAAVLLMALAWTGWPVVQQVRLAPRTPPPAAAATVGAGPWMAVAGTRRPFLHQVRLAPRPAPPARTAPSRAPHGGAAPRRRAPGVAGGCITVQGLGGCDRGRRDGAR